MARYVRRLVDALVHGDEPEAWRVTQTALGSASSPEDLYYDVLGVAMRRVGDEWAAGRLSVADEHRASALMYRLVGRLGPLFIRRGPRRGVVVLGAPSGDPHGLATALVADPLRGRGFEVADLGGDTPARSFADAVKQNDRVIGVGIVVSSSIEDAVVARAIAAVKAQRDLPVVLGGVAIRDAEHAAALGADVWTQSARAAVDQFEIQHHA
jgi:methanogenic corrinoid protein MtbC1